MEGKRRCYAVTRHQGSGLREERLESRVSASPQNSKYHPHMWCVNSEKGKHNGLQRKWAESQRVNHRCKEKG
jgi:hypothetical protein